MVRWCIEYNFKKVRDCVYILEGLWIVLDYIDEIIIIICELDIDKIVMVSL